MILKIIRLESIKKHTFAFSGLYVSLLFFFSTVFLNHSYSHNFKQTIYNFKSSPAKQIVSKISILSEIKNHDFFASEKEEKFDDENTIYFKKIDSINFKKFYFLKKVNSISQGIVFIRTNSLFLLFQQLKLPY